MVQINLCPLKSTSSRNRRQQQRAFRNTLRSRKVNLQPAVWGVDADFRSCRRPRSLLLINLDSEYSRELYMFYKVITWH